MNKQCAPFFILLTAVFLLTSCTTAPPAIAPTAISNTNQPANQPTIPPTNQQTIQPTPSAALPTPTPTRSPLLTTIGDPYAPELGNGGYDVQLYDIDLAIEPALATISGGVTITAVATEPLSQLALDFVGYQISETAVNNTPVPHTREDGKLLLTLPQPAQSGDTLEISVRYSGSPLEEPSRFVSFAPSLGLSFVGTDAAYILSEPDGTRYWLPNNDHVRDKAAFRYTLTVSEGLTAVANGILTNSSVTDGNATFVWEHQGPMSPYLATIAVGEYVRIDDQSPDGVPLRHYVFAEDQAEFARASAITGEVIDWMSELFGAYPFENFGFVTAEAPGASLETQTMVILSTRMIGQRTVVHEIAHMWFGNWVGLDSWSEMWRNEGFATYLTLMWEHRDDPEELELEMAAVASAVEDNENDFPLGNPPPELLFSFRTYFAGALMVHELRQTVGDDAFFDGLKLYFDRYGGATASDAEFQAIMEEASGQSLDAFFAEWLGEP